jgi:hypothetical protein
MYAVGKCLSVVATRTMALGPASATIDTMPYFLVSSRMNVWCNQPNKWRKLT